MRYAVVQSNLVVNIVEWDGVTLWVPPAGQFAVLIPAGSGADIGWTYDGASFFPPAA